MLNTALLIIDPQNDFILKGAPMAVEGAIEDSKRTADFIEKNIHDIDNIFITMDAHNIVDISHPSWWKHSNSLKNVDPFTEVEFKDLYKKYRANKRSWTDYYLRELESQGKFKHMVWPEHCIIGTNGQLIEKGILNAINKWERIWFGAEYIFKGTDPTAEYFGAFCAQVMSEDPSSHPNFKLLTQLNRYDRVLICGQARTHCVAYSIDQIVDYMPSLIKKIVLLNDATSNIKGFEEQAELIYKRAEKHGLQYSTTTEISF